MENYKGNLVEKWAEWLDSMPKELTLDTSDDHELSLFYLRCLVDEATIEHDKRTDSIISELFICSLIEKRIRLCHNYSVTKSVILVLSTMCISPGEAVMYCNYLQYKCFKSKINAVNMEVLSNWFPNGFYSHDVLDQAWDKQKLNGDNILDNREYSETISKL